MLIVIYFQEKCSLKIIWTPPKTQICHFWLNFPIASLLLRTLQYQVGFLWRVIAATSLVAMPSAKKISSKATKHFMRRVTAGAKAVFRGAHILEQKKRQVTSFVLLT